MDDLTKSAGLVPAIPSPPRFLVEYHARLAFHAGEDRIASLPSSHALVEALEQLRRALEPYRNAHVAAASITCTAMAYPSRGEHGLRKQGGVMP